MRRLLLLIGLLLVAFSGNASVGSYGAAALVYHPTTGGGGFSPFTQDVTPGVGNIPVPNGSTSCDIEMWPGSGGGGQSVGTDDAIQHKYRGGGGGGSGPYARYNNISLIGITGIDYQVGGKGIGITTPNIVSSGNPSLTGTTGGAGEDTYAFFGSFDGYLTGGGGGLGGTINPNVGGIGGAAGVSTGGTTPDVLLSGANGSAGSGDTSDPQGGNGATAGGTAFGGGIGGVGAIPNLAIHSTSGSNYSGGGGAIGYGSGDASNGADGHMIIHWK